MMQQQQQQQHVLPLPAPAAPKKPRAPWPVHRMAWGSYVNFKALIGNALRILSNMAEVEAGVTLELAKVPVYRSRLAFPVPADVTVLHFPTSEHPWQALKAKNWETFSMFMTGGALAKLTPEVMARLEARSNDPARIEARLAVGTKNAATWTQDGRAMAGIVPKLAVNPERARALGLALQTTDDYEYLTPATEAAVWHEILMAKFGAPGNAAAREVLLGTGDAYLVECVKSANTAHASVLAGKPGAREEHWGGLMNKETGALVGDNVMGRYLMRVRAALGGAGEPQRGEPEASRGVKRAREEDDAASSAH
jgi:predicted NAD-dependent protein-ADP-ribosyltransferase YbiA (DUF1768 family)